MAGLELASVGNHEFDKGASELRRMQEGGCAKFTNRHAFRSPAAALRRSIVTNR